MEIKIPQVEILSDTPLWKRLFYFQRMPYPVTFADKQAGISRKKWEQTHSTLKDSSEKCHLYYFHPKYLLCYKDNLPFTTPQSSSGNPPKRQFLHRCYRRCRHLPWQMTSSYRWRSSAPEQESFPPPRRGQSLLLPPAHGNRKAASSRLVRGFMSAQYSAGTPFRTGFPPQNASLLLIMGGAERRGRGAYFPCDLFFATKCIYIIIH